MESKSLNLKTLINRITTNIQVIKDLKRNLELNKYNLAKYKTLSRQLSFRKSKLRYYLEQFKKFGQGNYITVYYEREGKKYSATFTNIKKAEAIEIVKFMALVNFNGQIKILEIKDISTSINNLIL